MNLLVENKEDFSNVQRPIFMKFKFPLDSDEELQQLEDHLFREENYNKLVEELCQIRGVTAQDTTRKMMQKVVTNRFAQGYSWIGWKRKKVFGCLLLAKAIKAAVIKTQNGEESEVERVMKHWLVKAKTRMAAGLIEISDL